MIRFKVVRASRLMLYIAVALLAAVLGLIAFRLFSAEGSSTTVKEANLVEARSDEAKTDPVFASSDRTVASGKTPQNSGAAPIEIEIIPTDEPVRPKTRVLIYHTHTHEAYEQVSDDPYQALEAWRTTDADHSIVRVGEELAKRLEAYGMDVTHDVTDHEGSDLSTAYTRSLETLKGYSGKFDLYIDLHRDAWIEGTERAFSAPNGESMAQLMMLIGNGNGFDEKPYYRQNLAFAQFLTQRINRVVPGLCKPVLVKDGRYNQHIGVFSILVEVGNNRNTLHEALNAVPALAEAIYSLMDEEPEPALIQMKAQYDGTATEN